MAFEIITKMTDEVKNQMVVIWIGGISEIRRERYGRE